MITIGNHAFKGLDEALNQFLALQETMIRGIDALLELLPQGIDSADPGIFQRAKEIDKTINDAELACDRLIADCLNKYTILGEELRFVLGSVKSAGALERMADKLKNCHKRLSKSSHPLDGEIVGHMLHSIAALRRMVPLTLAQLQDYQPERTTQMLQEGAVVQASYRQTLLRLNTLGTLGKGGDAHHLLLIAKNLDQAADTAIEIMKIGHYVTLGSKYEKQKHDE